MPCLPQFRLMRLLRHLLLHAVCVGVCTFAAIPAAGQVLPALPKASPGAAIPGLRQEGLFLTAPVSVDGSPLFRIASPVSPAGGELPINVRLLYVQNAIAEILAEKDGGGTIFDPATLKVTVDRVGAQQTLVANDGKHASEAAEVPILTVTSADSQYANMSAALLAQQWQTSLESALHTALLKRQPQQIRRNLDTIARLGALLVVLTLAGIVLLIFLGRRAVRLRRRIAERQEQADREQSQPEDHPAPTEHQRRRTLALAVRTAQPEQRLQRVRAFSGALVWVLIALWVAGITWALLLFPQTTAYGQLVIRSAANVAFIWIGAGLLNKLADVVIVRFADAYARHGETSEDKARHVLRAPTISRSIGGFKGFIVVFVAALATLSALNIPIASVVTIGGVAALAIGFAAQSLVRDFLNGLLVIFEDQYVVGDYVMIGDYNGIVENLSLRIVQIRDVRGHLITIPHSAVSQVVNASRNWSRVDFRVPIEMGADLPKAEATLRETIESIAAEPQWEKAILDPVEWIGLENPSKNGVVLRAAIRTAPLRQFELNRVLNERVMAAFAEAEIPLGSDPLGVPVPGVNASPSPL